MPALGVLLNRLVPDRWREETPFSAEIKDFNRKLLDASQSDRHHAEVLNDWIFEHQPCLFGKMASKNFDGITYCIIRESEVSRGDRFVADKIREYRLHWKRQGVRGLKSAFVVALLSSRVCEAAP